MRSPGNTLRVWSWYSYEAALDEAVVFAAAAHKPEELRAVRSHLRLPEPAIITQLHPSAPGYSRAAGTPMRALWMPLEQFAARSSRWRDEDQLNASRLHALTKRRDKIGKPAFSAGPSLT